jgi:hypothetical protein
MRTRKILKKLCLLTQISSGFPKIKKKREKKSLHRSHDNSTFKIYEVTIFQKYIVFNLILKYIYIFGKWLHLLFGTNKSCKNIFF